VTLRFAGARRRRSCTLLFPLLFEHPRRQAISSGSANAEFEHFIKRLTNPHRSSSCTSERWPVAVLGLLHHSRVFTRNPKATESTNQALRVEHPLCDLRESSTILRVSISTVRRLIGDAALPTVRLRRRVLIDRADLEALIARSKVA
jgi:excisionase family DNA binding protein